MAIARARTRDSTHPKRVLPTPHLFTVDDYHKMVEIGVLNEDSRVELIDGAIVTMPPIGPEHVGSANWFTNALPHLFGDSGQVSIRNPVRLGGRLEPQPDVLVLRPRPDLYRSELPGPADVLLLIEIAESSLTYDRKTKARIYARAGIVDYWIVNLVDSVVEVHRDPARGRYRSVEAYGRGHVVQPLAFPAISIAVDDILGAES